jgi:hypothetical protein
MNEYRILSHLVAELQIPPNGCPDKLPDDRSNVNFLGGVGSGKNHLATAIGY